MQTNYTDGFFDISPSHGFMPLKTTLTKLPEEFREFQNIMRDLPFITKENRFGTLHSFGAIESVITKIPNYITILKEKEYDITVIQTLYRLYCKLVSSYCLEPTYRSYVDNHTYDKARTVIPENIAVPFCYVADKLGVFPWLEYHYSYGLGNTLILNKKDHFEYELEDLECASYFCGDLDEINFIKVHLLINLCTPRMIEGIFNTLSSVGAKDSSGIVEGLRKVYQTVVVMNEKRRVMWGSSDMKRYGSYRIFLMGITGNEKIFGEGVIFSGVNEEPVKYRGETGAQDDIVPTLDIFSGVTEFYPDTILTKYLEDLRQYRPKIVIKFFKDLERESKGLFDRVYELSGVSGLIYLAAVVNEIYNFRNGHWQFVQKYIMRNTTYNVATGGTPLNMWLPNQIKACLEKMQQILTKINSESQKLESVSEEARTLFNKLNNDHPTKKALLDEQMRILKGQFNIEEVIKLDDKQT